MNPSPAALARDLITPVAFGLLACALLARWADAWAIYPDLAHAWAVPLLAACLAWERRPDCPPARPATTPLFATAAAALFATLYLAGRALLAPFPAWPAALWLFSAAGWTLALGLIASAGGVARARHFAFPLLFTATALPWLTWMDLRLVLPLREGLAIIAAEVVHTLGYPTSVAGTVITVGRGQVGVDEACSGIRSLQTVIMLALFLGELMRFGHARRLALLGFGVTLALVSNLGRTCFLAWQAATGGPEAATLWHDRAGQAQLLVTLGGLALVVWRWNRFACTPAPAIVTADAAGITPAALPRSPRKIVAFALIALVLAVEAGVAAWFRPDPHARATAGWRAALPTLDFSYKSETFGQTTHDLLRCDDYQAGSWETPAGHRRAGYVLDWDRGEIARDIIALHNPGVCLPLGGQRFVSVGEVVQLPITDNLSLPFHSSAFAGDQGALFVFYLAWDMSHSRPLTPTDEAEAALLGWWSQRLGEIASRRGRFAARVVAFAIYDEPDLAAATATFLREAPALVSPTRN